MSSRCGGCRYFAPWPGDNGLCERYDCRTKADDGQNCRGFKAPKFNRVKSKEEIRRELLEAIGKQS